MALAEAWTVTALGMLVVFTGLVLCILFIQIFNRVAGRVAWADAGHGAHGGHGPHGAPAPAEPAPAPPPDLPPGEPVSADVVAVIAAVLEIESKLYLSKPGARLTIRRAAARY